MCIVIDVNRIPSVFNPRNSDHHEFQPIIDWIESRSTMIVYGGTEYKKELKKMPKYLPILLQRKKAGQVYEVDDESVDTTEREILLRTQGTTCNDQFIIAIVIVSRCQLICSSDKKSFPFLRNKSLYPSNFKRPSIYTGTRNIDKLQHSHKLDKCGPCCSRS